MYAAHKLKRTITHFSANTMNIFISSDEYIQFSFVLRTHENIDVFSRLDEDTLAFTAKE